MNRTPTIATHVPITDIMTRRLVTAPPTTPVEDIIELLRDRHVGCVPIVDQAGRPIGVVTKLDLIQCFGEARKSAREVMMPLAVSVAADATVAHAAAMMSMENIHHVLVVAADRTLLGIVSSLDIARWLARNDGLVGSA